MSENFIKVYTFKVRQVGLIEIGTKRILVAIVIIAIIGIATYYLFFRKVRGQTLIIAVPEEIESTDIQQVSWANIVHDVIFQPLVRFDLDCKTIVPDLARNYPHQLSGGMRQRSMIAMMISCRPSLLIADEPTTALDVTIQAQILDLIVRLKEDLDSAVMLITHDFGIVAEVGDRVGVMYLGNIVELGSVTDIFDDPLHPYTKGLLRALPLGIRRKENLDAIPGSLPSPINPPSGCKFHPRCKYSRPLCSKVSPSPVYLGDGRWVSCHLYS